MVRRHLIANGHMLTGLNHVTLAVRELERSIGFHRGILGFKLAAQWDTGAYLELGDLWLCLSLDDTASGPRIDYTHYVFSLWATTFAAFADKQQRSPASGRTIAAK